MIMAMLVSSGVATQALRRNTVKSSESKLPSKDRRGFLRDVVATSSSVAVLSVTSGIGVANASTEAKTRQTEDGKGYRVTQHVLDYYRTASF